MRSIKELIVIECAYYNVSLQDMTISVWAEELQDLGPERLQMIYKQLRKGRKQIPHPADVLSAAANELSTEAKAVEVASRIRAAITHYGWPNANEARAWIGELGWKVVERSGGWVYLCEHHGVALSPLTFHAQARDLAKSMIESAELGVFDQPIGIPHQKTHELGNSSGSGLQRLSLIPKKPTEE